MKERLAKALSQFADSKNREIKEVLLPLLHECYNELSQYASVTDKMRQAAWKEVTSCDIPYTKIYQIMDKQKREA